MGDAMDDAQAREFYADPANLVPAGPAHRPQRPAMSRMVPVRFQQDMITAVKRFANQDGMTVSTWIRRLVAKEIERREPPATSTTAAKPMLDVRIEGSPASMSSPAMEQKALVAC